MDVRAPISVSSKVYLKKILKYWYLFLFGVVLSFFLARIYIKYQVKSYETISKILIRDQNQSSYMSSVVDELALSSGYKNMYNEMALLKSFPLITETLKKLPLHATIIRQGEIKSTELYKDSPFQIAIDSNHRIPVGVKFVISPIDNNTFELTARGEALSYDYFKCLDGESFDINLNKKFAYDEQVSLGHGTAFSIKRNVAQWSNHDPNTSFYFTFNEIDQLYARFTSQLKLRPEDENRSSVLKVKLTSANKEMAVDFVNALVKNFIDRDLQEKNKATINSIAFIDEQLDTVKSRLLESEKALERFRQKENIHNIELYSEQTHENIIADERLKAELLFQRKTYLLLLDYLENNESLNESFAPSTSGVTDQFISQSIAELQALYSELVPLGLYGGEQSPRLIEVKEKIKAIKRLLQENVSNLIRTTELKLEELENKLEYSYSVVEDLPGNERRYFNILQKYQMNQHMYNYLLEKRTSAGIARSLNAPDNRVIEFARTSTSKKIAPNESRIILSFLFMGALLPLVIIAFKEFLFMCIEGKESVTDVLKMPFIGEIVHQRSDGKLLLLEDPKSSLSESFRSLRINLEYTSGAVHGGKVIGFTSCVSGEGKTFCAFNLGVSISTMGKKALLIGADLRKPKLGKEFDINFEIGMSNFLSGSYELNEVIQKTKVANVDIIPSGPIPPNPVELLSNERMDMLIKSVKQSYDYIIIDSTPIGLVSDFYAIKKLVDINIFVLRDRYTRIRNLKLVKEFYEKNEDCQTFLLLNDLRTPNVLGYSYGYGYYEDRPKSKLWNIFKKREV